MVDGKEVTMEHIYDIVIVGGEPVTAFSRNDEIMPLFSCRGAAQKYSLRSTHALQSKALRDI